MDSTISVDQFGDPIEIPAKSRFKGFFESSEEQGEDERIPMKVNVYPSTVVNRLDRVIEKNSDQRSGSQSHSQSQQNENAQNSESENPTFENIQKAVEDFSANEVHLTHGISAIQEGSGPGLKVTLRDASGGILRSVSGEEFLKLREALQSGSKSGRILDQKV